MSASFQKSQTKKLKEAFWQHLKLANLAFEWLFYSENNNNNCETSMWAERLVHMVNPPRCENTQWGAPILRTAFLNQLLIPLLSFFKYRGTNPLAYPVQSYIICKYLSNPFFPFWFV